MDEIEALFDKVMAKAAPPSKPKKKKVYQNGAGYDYEKVWKEDGSTYTYRSKARVLYEKYHNVKLEDCHRIFFRDATLKGDDRYSKDNLVLGYKAGVPLDLLTCSNCGCRGNWRIDPPTNGNQRGAEE